MGVAAKPRLAVVFLMILSLGVSLGLPAEDVLDAVYDESEAVPFEAIPLLARDAEVLKELVTTLQSPLELGLHLGSDFLTGRYEVRATQAGEPLHLISESVTILDHCLRC